MSELLHKILYAGIGLAALSEQKAKEIVADLEKRGEISAEEGKKLAQEIVDKARHHGEQVRKLISEEVEKLSGKLKIVSRREFDDLQQRVSALESKCSSTHAGE